MSTKPFFPSAEALKVLDAAENAGLLSQSDRAAIVDLLASGNRYAYNAKMSALARQLEAKGVL